MENYGMKAFLLKDALTIVTDKSTIKNAKEEDFVKVTLIMNEKEIEDLYKRIQKTKEEDK
jgi:hypothetical protein